MAKDKKGKPAAGAAAGTSAGAAGAGAGAGSGATAGAAAAGSAAAKTGTAAAKAATTTAAAADAPVSRVKVYVPPAWFTSLQVKARPCVFTGCPGDHTQGTPCAVQEAHLKKFGCAAGACRAPRLSTSAFCKNHDWAYYQ